MVVMELFGMNGAGKTTTILELEKRCEIKLPVASIENYSYLMRNGRKGLNVLVVIFHDLPFAIRLLAMMWRKHGWTWDTPATWFNICHRGYFYLFGKKQRTVLAGGILHKVWGTYGLVPITEQDRKEILLILDHFHCKGGYYLDVSKEVILKRNTNRGRNTFLERRLNELDFLYDNFYSFIEAVEKHVEICPIRENTLQGRVEFLLEDCQELKSKRESLAG